MQQPFLSEHAIGESAENRDFFAAVRRLSSHLFAALKIRQRLHPGHRLRRIDYGVKGERQGGDRYIEGHAMQDGAAALGSRGL